MPLLKKILGVLCVLVGIIALLTPLTPGSWLIIVGLGLLGVEIAVAEDHKLAALAKRLGMKLKPKKAS